MLVGEGGNTHYLQDKAIELTIFEKTWAWRDDISSFKLKLLNTNLKEKSLAEVLIAFLPSFFISRFTNILNI